MNIGIGGKLLAECFPSEVVSIPKDITGIVSVEDNKRTTFYNFMNGKLQSISVGVSMSIKDEGYWADSELWTKESKALKKELDEEEIPTDESGNNADDNESGEDAGELLPDTGV